MFCTNCEFEIKGDDRKECPVCGGPLIDYAEVKTPSEEIASTVESDRWEETPNAPKEKAPFDFGRALEADDEHPKEPDEYVPLSSLGKPEPQAEVPGEERSAEDAQHSDLSKSTGESDRWEKTPNASKEKAPFDFGRALEADDEHPVKEPEESAPLLSQSETERKPEAADTPQSIEEVVPDSYTTFPEEIFAAVQQTERNSTPSSRKQLAISVMGVLALVAAITTIAIIKPQQHLNPDIGHLKTKTEKTVGKILSIITQREEKEVVAQIKSEQRTRLQQRQREHAAGNADPGKKQSRLEELPSGNKEKEATVHKQLKAPHGKPLAKQAADHVAIASLQKTLPPLVKKDMQSSGRKRSTKNTLARETVPVIPDAKKTSHSRLYSIHTGSFKNKEVAIGEIDRLAKMGFRAYLHTVDLENGETWHRIKIGSYSTREEAEKTQNELRQKEPTIKSYIMRRVTEPKKTAAQRNGTTSIKTAGIAPFVPGPEKREPLHAKPAVPETVPTLKKPLTPKAEQPIIEMKAAAYLIPPLEKAPQAVPEEGEILPLLKENFAPEIEQPITEMKEAAYLTPPAEETPQTLPEEGEALPLLKENFAPEIEQLITEMGGNPFSTLLAGEEIPSEDAGSIGTVPKEDHPPAGNTVPEDMVHEGKEAVTPVD